MRRPSPLPWPLIGQTSSLIGFWLSLDQGCKMPHLKEPRTNKCQKRCLGEREKLCTNTSQCREDWWQVGRERNNWHCLDSSHQHRVSLYPPHTSLQIGEYMNILHCAQCHYQTGPCQNIPAPSQNISSSSRYSFEEINQEINDGVTSLEASFSPTPYLRYTNHDQ